MLCCYYYHYDYYYYYYQPLLLHGESEFQVGEGEHMRRSVTMLHDFRFGFPWWLRTRVSAADVTAFCMANHVCEHCSESSRS